MNIDTILTGRRRRLRTCPDRILTGSGGYRLTADVLDPVPGFVGRIDFIHKLNLPGLFSVRVEGIGSYEPVEVLWKPSHIVLDGTRDGVRFHEEKFITLNDTAVSCLELENSSDREIAISIEPVFPEGCVKTSFGEKLRILIAMDGTILEAGRTIRLAPDMSRVFCISAFVCLESEWISGQAAFSAERFADAKTALQDQIREYQAWFDQVPVFESSDRRLDQLWAYRWFLLRHNMMWPRLGNLKYPYVCEGRSHKMTKEPFHPTGWEFTKLIPLSSPMHLLELRWYRDRTLTYGLTKTLSENCDEAGEFVTTWVDHHGASYVNFFSWAVWQDYLSTGDPAYVQEALPAAKNQVLSWRKKYGNDQDALLTVYVHQLTGMEYQPSFFYFTGYPDNCKDSSLVTPVKRVDQNVFQILNAYAVGKLCEVAGDSDAELFYWESERVRQDLFDKMWDEESGFFYDLHFKTNEKAYVKELVGAFPFFGNVAGAKYREALQTVLSEEFATSCLFPSVSVDCPVFSGEGGWKQWFFKGRNGCIWNGPAWPFSNSIILDAIGSFSTENGHEMDEAFRRCFENFCALHYHGGNGDVPYLVEHYDSITGDTLSDEADYLHSYMIDLIVRYIAGVEPEENGVRIDPIDIGLSHFSLKRLPLRGHLLDVVWDRKTGLEVWCDGMLLSRRPDLGPLEAAISLQNER